MMQFLLFILLIMNSFMFMFMNHPLTMGFILMIQTILISLFTGMYTFFFWFSYSLFLIFMGGMLILFMYMTSLASNEMFKFSVNFNKLSLFMILMMCLMMIFFFTDFKNFIMNNKIMNMDNLSLNFWQNSMEKNFYFLNKMFNFPMNFITILLVNYLFLTLIATVKITNIFKGPIRSKYI